MASEGLNIDPRFDPLFQRGYQGGMRDSASPVTQSVNPPSAAGSDQITAPPASPEPELARAKQVPEDERYLPVVMTDYAGERPEPRKRVNPFIVLLWIVGPGLVILGVVGARELFSQQWGNNFSPVDASLLQVTMIAAQAAITVGFATVAGLLFWHAAAWRRARS